MVTDAPYGLVFSRPVRLWFRSRSGFVAEIPDLAASTVGGIVLADLNKAMVRREVAQAELLCLRERYADARQIGYFGFIRTDIRSNDLRAAAVCEPAST